MGSVWNDQHLLRGLDHHLSRKKVWGWGMMKCGNCKNAMPCPRSSSKKPSPSHASACLCAPLAATVHEAGTGFAQSPHCLECPQPLQLESMWLGLDELWDMLQPPVMARVVNLVTYTQLPAPLLYSQLESMRLGLDELWDMEPSAIGAMLRFPAAGEAPHFKDLSIRFENDGCKGLKPSAP